MADRDASPVPERLRRLAGSISRALNGNVAVRAAKNVRNAVVDHAFRRRQREDGRRLAAALAARGTRDAVFTIAFNSPWVVDLLTQAWARHQPDVSLVVIDNSTDRSARLAHEKICLERRIDWLPLPRNPEWNPNRSHGIALNWTWFNVIQRTELAFAGFVDHDCIPVAAFDLRRRMEGLDAYGYRMPSTKRAEAWNIWPGYCFLRPAAAARHRIDFKHRIEYGLDTGGGNWRDFYRRLDDRRTGAATCRTVHLDLDGESAACLLLDDAFLHLGGASYVATFRDPDRRRRFGAALLERPFDGGPIRMHGAPTAGR